MRVYGGSRLLRNASLSIINTLTKEKQITRKSGVDGLWEQLSASCRLIDVVLGAQPAKAGLSALASSCIVSALRFQFRVMNDGVGVDGVVVGVVGVVGVALNSKKRQRQSFPVAEVMLSRARP